MIVQQWELTRPAPPFRPRPIDKENAQQEVERIASGLLPHGVDEATGHAVDNLVNAWAVDWAIAVKRQHLEYAARADGRVERAAAKRIRPLRRHEHNQQALVEAATARQAALAELTGQPATHPDAAATVTDGRPGTGYTGASLPAGRTAGSYLHVLAFTVAGLADAAALWQVMQLLMPRQSPWLSALVVAGLATAVLYLAHLAGALFRDRVASVPWIRPPQAWLCVAGWLTLGMICFWIRLVVVVPGPVPVIFGPTSANSPPPSVSEPVLENAVVFLGLYLGAGLVAAIGGYLTRNPLLARYRAAHRAHRRAARRAGASGKAIRTADARWRAELAARHSGERIRDCGIHDCATFASALKQHARLVLARGVQDPAFTDAVLDQDWRGNRLWSGHHDALNGAAPIEADPIDPDPIDPDPTGQDPLDPRHGSP
ncbi:MAG: hypothetical protein ACRDRV_11020 [Pseudonocardiaceae bacterium]